MFWWRRKQREQDLERELRSDLESEAEEQRQAGLSPEEARYAARRAFGNATLVKEDVRKMWGWTSFERFWQDVRYSLRTLRKAPVFTATALLSVGLGIGANTAIFTLLYTVLLKPLPVPNPEALVVLGVRDSRNQRSRTLASPTQFSKPCAPEIKCLRGLSLTYPIFSSSIQTGNRNP